MLKAIVTSLPSRKREGNVWTATLCALALSSPALAGPKPKPGFEPALPPAAAAPHPADGAIFNAAASYAPLTAGHRARAVGDPLTIVLVESTSTSKSAGSKTDRSGSFGITPPTAGPLSFLNPNALKAGGQSSFKGQGNATQTSSLAGEVSVTIAEVRANGTALVRGEKRLLLSQGQEWIQLTGIVRLSDLDSDNRVASSRVADARIEYAGNGAVARASREGWLSKFFNAISPF
ncbi:MAG: flagellar basal body L-ring protein FlgH [Novosphingobium sp.]|uniref:flagellar basal body L-ring protein FlgH n=1 Tax=Novosphingobium sp. TaxID=1874826 RepID=UPI0032B708CE